MSTLDTYFNDAPDDGQKLGKIGSHFGESTRPQGVNYVKMRTLLRIADSLERIADSLEKATGNISEAQG